MLSTVNDLLAGNFPWWLPTVIGFAGGAAIVVLMGLSRVSVALALAALAIGVSVSAYDKGYQEGSSYQKAAVEKAKEEERARLREVNEQAVRKERERAEKAERLNTALKEQVDAILSSVGDANGNPVVLPEPLARRVYDLKGRR